MPNFEMDCGCYRTCKGHPDREGFVTRCPDPADFARPEPRQHRIAPVGRTCNCPVCVLALNESFDDDPDDYENEYYDQETEAFSRPRRPPRPPFDRRIHWVTREGQRLLIREMGDGHLCNTIRFLERQYRERKEFIRRQESLLREEFDFDGDEMDCAFGYLIEKRRARIDDVYPSVPYLKREARRRGLDWSIARSMRPSLAEFVQPHHGRRRPFTRHRGGF